MSVGNIYFKQGTSEEYNQLTIKNNNTIYFLNDTKELYKGSERFSSGDVASLIKDGLMSKEDYEALQEAVNNISQLFQDVSDLTENIDRKYTKPSNGIPEEDIANDAITGPKIADGAVTDSKLAENINITTTGNISASKMTSGANNEASGTGSHAEGNATRASGKNSHAEGLGTIANEDYQHVSGKYNANNANALFIVGNGTDSTHRSNALEVLKNGDVIIGNTEITNHVINLLNDNSIVSAVGDLQISSENDIGIFSGGWLNISSDAGLNISSDGVIYLSNLYVEGADGDSFSVDWRGITKGRVTNIVDLSEMSIDVTQYTLDVDAGTTWADIVNDARYNPLIKKGNNFYRLFKIYNNGTNEVIISGDDQYNLFEEDGSGPLVKATDRVKFKDEMSGYPYKMISGE